jgi:hypothetical protein
MAWLFVLTAMPALAAEGQAGEEGEINGVLFALIVGSLVGTWLFLDAYADDGTTNTTGHGS